MLPEPLRVRMGLHTGSADLRDGDYYGRAVNRAVWVSAAAHGGQILLSHATQELLLDALPAGVTLIDLGAHRFRGISRPEHAFQLAAAGLDDAFPSPPDSRRHGRQPARAADVLRGARAGAGRRR